MRRALLVLLVCSLVAVVGLAVTTPPTVVAGAGETVRGDQEATGATVVVAGTVDGDLRAFGGTVVITGTVTGDVQAFGSTVRVAGDVGGTTVAYGGAVVVAENATLGRSLNAGGGTVRLAGTVADDAQVLGGRLLLAETARVDGNLVYDARLVDGGGTVTGARDPTSRYLGPLGAVFRLTRFAPLFVPGLAAALALVATRWLGPFVTDVTDRFVTRPRQCLVSGVATVLGLGLAVVLLAVSLVGLPVAAVLLTLGGTLGLIGLAAGQVAVGRRMLAIVERHSNLGAAVVGAVSVAIVWQLPAVGAVVSSLVLVVGLGAVVSVGRQQMNRRRQR